MALLTARVHKSLKEQYPIDTEAKLKLMLKYLKPLIQIWISVTLFGEIHIFPFASFNPIRTGGGGGGVFSTRLEVFCQ